MATAIEYGLIAVLVVVAGVTAINGDTDSPKAPEEDCAIKQKTALKNGGTNYSIICPAGKTLDLLAVQADVETVPPG